MLDIVFKLGLNINLTNILEPIVGNLEISKNGVLRHWITVAMVTHHYTTQLPLTFFIFYHNDAHQKVSTRSVTMRAHIWLTVTENCY